MPGGFLASVRRAGRSVDSGFKPIGYKATPQNHGKTIKNPKIIILPPRSGESMVVIGFLIVFPWFWGDLGFVTDGFKPRINAAPSAAHRCYDPPLACYDSLFLAPPAERTHML